MNAVSGKHFMSFIHVYNVYTLGKGNGETVQNNRNQDQRQTRRCHRR